MGIKNFFKKQLSTVIEWTDQDPSILFYKFPSITDEVKNASKLIIAPGQGCIIVYEGKIQTVSTTQGAYFIETDNHPFITSLLKLRQSFESEHKLRVYFFRTADILNQRWGTATPIKYMDNTYKFPVEVGAYGNYSLRLKEPSNIFTNIIGSKDIFTTDDLRSVVVARVIPEMTSFLAKNSYSYLNIDAHLNEISEAMKENLSKTFNELGLEIIDFRIEATSFDEKSKERINKIAGMTAESLSAAEVGLDYVQLEKLRALRDAAKNEGGLAGAGLQIGTGLELSRSLMSQKDDIINNSGNPVDPVEQLKKLKLLLDENILTQEEFDEKKKEILSKF